MVWNGDILMKYIAQKYSDTLEFIYFQLHPLLTQVFSCTYSWFNLPRKALPVEWDALEKLHKVSVPNAKRQLEGIKPPALGCGAVELCYLERWNYFRDELIQT